MTDSMESLRRAAELIKANRRAEAVQVLLPVLKANEQDANAWWLMANALTDPDDAREALETLLRLRPDHEKAQRMLARINELYPRPAPEPEPEPEPKPGEFGSGDSASDPFAGADLFAAPGASAPPVESYTVAEQESEEDPFAFAPSPQEREAAAPAYDPFGPAQSFGPPVADEEDPFAFAPPTTEWQAAAPAYDPFGPAQSFGPPAAETEEDPFAVKSAAGQPAAEAPRRKTRPRPAEGDLFGAAAGTGSRPGARTAQPRQAKQRPAATTARTATTKGTNPLVILLAVLGGLVLLVCLGCLALTYVLPTIGVNVAQQVISQIDTSGVVATLQAEGFPIDESVMGTLQAGGISEMIGTLEAGGVPPVLQTLDASGVLSFEAIGSPLPAGVIGRGSLGYGESRRDTLDAGQQHGWTFSGGSGDQVVIELVASDAGSGFDPVVALYDPQNLQVAYNDDGSSEGYDSRLEFTLTGSGTYTILVREFAYNGGKYELRLNRR
ncbi:MAG: hypothetical protein HPY64_07495 [Anaerolineae bacterium]|nr:hypothetical protein [Anaerolineae bacterium]